MRQINVRLDEELIKRIKQFALDNNLTFQEVVKQSLLTHIPPTERSTQSESKQSVD